MISADGDAEVLGDVLDGRAGVDLDDVGRRIGRAGVEGRGLLVEVAPAAASATAAGTALRGPPPGPPGPPGPPPGPRRAAWESITTRRTPPALPGARSPWRLERVRALAGAVAGARAAAAVALVAAVLGGARASAPAGARTALTGVLGLAGPSPVPSGRSMPGGRCGRCGSFLAVAVGQRLAGDGRRGHVLVDGRGGGLELDAGLLEALADLLRGQVELAG